MAYWLIIAIIISLSEMIKGLRIFHKRLIPLLTVCLGIAFATSYYGKNLRFSLCLGLLLGIGSCGIYSTGKNILQAIIGSDSDKTVYNTWKQ